MKKRLLVWFGILVFTCLVVVALVPPWRCMLIGFLRGERLYRGRPTSYWINALKDENPATRREAAYALGPLPPEPDRDVPSLGGTEAEAAVPALTEALKDEDIVVRRYAVTALESMGLDARAAIPALVARMKDRDESVRETAAHALEFMEGIDPKVAIPPLTEALQDRDSAVRVAAASALWRVGGRVKAAVPVLIKVLQNNKNPNLVRRKAAWSLGSIGPLARKAIPSLRQALKDEDESMRQAAAEALQKIDPDATEETEAP